ncbi:MAG: hypothetical protein V5A55_10910 [Halovenus sp.]
MSMRVADRVEDWERQSFDGGFRELHTLADREFSGVVRAGTAELYMASGACVGVRQGSIDDFEGGSGTVYRAPSDALPLLAVMQERADEVHAKYYSEKTSIAEVDRTLSDGGFTGYIELSENVLSGDYYLVYHAGKSMSVAYVGESKQLLDGDEAFERADGEVGIYQVYKVDVDIVDLPEPSSGADGGAGSRADDSTVGGEPGLDDTGRGEDVTTSLGGDPTEQGGDAQPGSSDPAGSTPEDTPTARTDSHTDETGPRPAAGTEHRPDSTSGERTDSATTDGPTTEAAETGRTTNADTGGTQPAGEQPTGKTRGDGLSETATPDPSAGVTEPQRSGSANQTQHSGETGAASDLEQRTVPSLDPERTAEQGEPLQSGTQPGSTPEAQPEPPSEPAQGAEAGGPEPTADPDAAADADRIEHLESELAGVREERNAFEADLAELRSERDDLKAEVERLRSDLEHLETELGAATDAQQRLTASEALAGTDLFIRYHSKGDPTLEKAHNSGVRKENVNENLRIETHTAFDDTNVAVSGQSFHKFLESTPQYQFVRWVVRELLFEIRSTGHEKGLGDLYDALPDVDRAELSGVVELTYTEDGQERRTEEAFDVILRDRMGNPLLAANLNDSREAATESMIEQLITAAERVGRSVDEFAAAFMVTQSFFEPGALETTSAATRGGLLSRDKRRSFVKISRKRGYHLCLVEARNDNFHLTVPEL